MPLRNYGKWNIRKFCHTYFDSITNSDPDSYHSLLCDQPIEDRCADPEFVEEKIEEIRVSLADCKPWAKRPDWWYNNNTLKDNMRSSVDVLACALECYKDPSIPMVFESFMGSEHTFEKYPILV